MQQQQPPPAQLSGDRCVKILLLMNACVRVCGVMRRVNNNDERFVLCGRVIGRWERERESCVCVFVVCEENGLELELFKKEGVRTACVCLNLCKR